mgnify:CR=1 FL=1
MTFKYNYYAVRWEYVKFGDDEAEIFRQNKKSLQKLKITEFQKIILKSFCFFLLAEIFVYFLHKWIG